MICIYGNLTKVSVSCLHSGGSPYPRIEGRKMANLLHQGYRMPKPKHVDDAL